MGMTVVARGMHGDIALQLTAPTNLVILEPDAALELARALQDSVLYLANPATMAKN
jgi:hypothetical protein